MLIVVRIGLGLTHTTPTSYYTDGNVFTIPQFARPSTSAVRVDINTRTEEVDLDATLRVREAHDEHINLQTIRDKSNETLRDVKTETDI